MSVRIKQKGLNIGVAGDDDFTEVVDTSLDQRTAIDNEGYQYHFGPNETRNFADDGRGISIEGSGTTINVSADPIPFGSELA
ncbi:MAG TPA: hypothetical protein VF974_07480 [Patescibacteria group bacterium]